MNEEQVNKVLAKMVVECGQDCVEELVEYGGLAYLLLHCDGSEEGIADCWDQACMNV